MESFDDFKRGKPRKFSISPRLKKLKEDFIKNGGKFEKYKIGKYFYVKGNPQLNKESFCFSKGAQYPYFTRTAYNNGILGYVDYLDEEHKIKGNSLAVGMIAMQFFYMEHDFYAGQFTKTVYPKFEKFNAKIAQYFISIFNKHQDLLKGVLVRDFENTFINSYIEFPMLNNQISFEYIENYISELEEERISELTAYLKVSGLEDYKLTKEEYESIDRINKNTIEFQEFRIEDVLSWQSQKEIDPLKINLLTIKNNIKYPFYGQATINHGVISYESLKETVLNNKTGKPTILVHSNNQNCIYLETPFYLKDGHGATSVLQNDNLNELNAHYIITCISKVITKKFNYDNKATKIALKNTKISLPVNKNNEIDYDFMETYINAIEKLVIKNVVEWRDKQISTTKQIINND